MHFVVARLLSTNVMQQNVRNRNLRPLLAKLEPRIVTPLSRVLGNVYVNFVFFLRFLVFELRGT